MIREEYEAMKVKDRVAMLREKLAGDNAWAVRGLMLVYEQQTRDEQQSEETREWNKVGFSAFDAEILTSFAKRWQESRKLSPKQVALLRKKIPRYARQIEKLTRTEV